MHQEKSHPNGALGAENCVDSNDKKIRLAGGQVRAEEAQNARHPLDDLQARLLVMQLSLRSMKRFLGALERDLEDALGLRRRMRTRPKIPEADPGSGPCDAKPD